MADDPAGRLWSGIEWEIRRGRHPNRDDVIAALRLGDPRPLPADVQLYVARLLAGEIDQRGRQSTVPAAGSWSHIIWCGAWIDGTGFSGIANACRRHKWKHSRGWQPSTDGRIRLLLNENTVRHELNY